MRNFVRYIYIFFILILAGTSVSADNFSNNLLKTDITRSEVDGININLSTSKPYQDKVLVNKKNDNQYVILMPETTNSTVTKPTLNGVSDIVSDVSIKTQQYQGNIKGYTKITITTKKPVTINPRVSVEKTQNTITEKEIAELMSGVKSLQQKSMSKPQPQKIQVPKVVKAPTVVPKPQLKQIQNSIAQNKINVQKSAEKALQNVKNRVVKSSAKSTIKKNVTRPEKPKTAINTIKPVTENISRHSITENVGKSQVVTEQSQLKQVPSSHTDIEQIQNQTTSEDVNNTTEDVTLQSVQENQPTEQQIPISEKLTTKQLIIKYARILKNNILIFATLLIFAILSMLAMARKMTASIQRAKINFNANLNNIEKAAVDYTSRINEDMNWQEKYNACADDAEPKLEIEQAETELDEPEIIESEVIQSDNADLKSDIDDLFNPSNAAMTEEQEVSYDNQDLTMPVQDETTPSENEKTLLNNSEVAAQNDDDEQYIPEEENVPPVITEQLDNSYVNNSMSEINPSDYENAELFDSTVSAQDLFADEEIIESPVIPINPILSGTENYTNEDNQSDDEIFDTTSVLETQNTQEYDTQDTQNAQSEFTDLSQITDNDDIFAIYEKEFMNKESESDIEIVDNENTDTDEIVKSEYVIDENKGFYLVDFEDSSALVGHINDNIFVLKKFADKVDAPLKARVNEIESNSTRYMARVGNFRGVVEVTSDKMNLLVEL